jgi:hypothetical protein
MTDHIDKLPVDQNPVSHQEAQIVETLFKENKNEIKTTFEELKDSLMVGILFLVLSLPQTERLIQSFLPSTQNVYILIAIKTVVFVFFLYIIQNIVFAKTK